MKDPDKELRYRAVKEWNAHRESENLNNPPQSIEDVLDVMRTFTFDEELFFDEEQLSNSRRMILLLMDRKGTTWEEALFIEGQITVAGRYPGYSEPDDPIRVMIFRAED